MLNAKPKLVHNANVREDSVLSICAHGFHRVAYRDWGNPKSKNVTFCLHGLTRNSHDFDYFAPQLAKKHRVICPDTAGRGQSDWLFKQEDYQLSQYNVDFANLASHIGAEQYNIVGTSLGGLMGMILASMPNTPVQKLVVNDIAPEVPYSALQRLSQYLGKNPLFKNEAEAEAYFRKTFAPYGSMDDDKWAYMTKTSIYEVDGGYRLAYDPMIAKNYKRYWLLAYFNLWSYWKRIQCPILILRGKESDFLTDNLLERMLKRQPEAELIEFEEVGHTPTLNVKNQIDPVLKWLNEK